MAVGLTVNASIIPFPFANRPASDDRLFNESQCNFKGKRPVISLTATVLATTCMNRLPVRDAGSKIRSTCWRKWKQPWPSERAKCFSGGGTSLRFGACYFSPSCIVPFKGGNCSI